MNTMTVGELREQLKKFPDTHRIQMQHTAFTYDRARDKILGVLKDALLNKTNLTRKDIDQLSHVLANELSESATVVVALEQVCHVGGYTEVILEGSAGND